MACTIRTLQICVCAARLRYGNWRVPDVASVPARRALRRAWVREEGARAWGGRARAATLPSPRPPRALERMRFGPCLWCGALESQLVTRMVVGKENWAWMRENGTLCGRGQRITPELGREKMRVLSPGEDGRWPGKV